ncbi:GMC oxidoreductase [Hysterangium stoloniferum]|nr:GMC oxidoreductase [Hysterangium stoloniferum]
MSSTLSDIVNVEFDYVIAGGGTAGLALAARLSEDPAVTVAVIEAGREHIDDPNVDLPGQFGHKLHDPNYAWLFATTKQPHSANREFAWPRGKGLGGSSFLNFFAWIKPPAADVDAIEKLGNPGWNWESFFKYSKKSETFHEPTAEQLSLYPLTFKPENRGNSGPVQTEFPRQMLSLEVPWQVTMQNLGIKTNEDPTGGDINGTWIGAASIDPRTHTRSYARTAYYAPNSHRKNLFVLTEATATRVLFADMQPVSENLTATRLEFIHASNPSRRHVVRARKEVILSTGALKSPQLLELSGIGRQDVLRKIGVDVKIDLPGVGENVQEHIVCTILWEVGDEHQTYDVLRDVEHAAEQLKLHAKGEGLHTTSETSFVYLPLSFVNPTGTPTLVESVSNRIEAQKKSGNLPPGLLEQLELQMAALRDEAIPDIELILLPQFLAGDNTVPEAGKKYATASCFLNHPFSRGTIHAISPDPTQQAAMDPHVFEDDFDLEILVQQFKFIRKIAETEPWKSTLVREQRIYRCASVDFIRRNCGASWHTVGSCSMLPREKLGVVDPQLKVYGTNNLRVVDISIIPLHVAAHTQTFAYMIGEKAADIIRGNGV